MAQNPKKPQQPAPQAPLTRRAMSRHQRELRRQRLVVTVTGAAVGLALVAVLAGLLYDRLWIPSRPVAHIGGATLSRGDYWTERRNDIARRMAQTLQLLNMFGSQFGSQFEGQIPQLDAEVQNIRSGPVDDATVGDWVQRQVIAQNAAQEFHIQASDGEIAQRLVADLSRVFPAPQPAPTSTTTLTPTTTVSGTSAVPAATSAATTSAETAAAGTSIAPTTTTGPTETPAPTTTPTATPLPDLAAQEADAILGRLYDAYQQELFRLSPEQKARLTLEDFKAALHDQYLQQVITSRVQEQLVPQADFTPSTEPSSIETRHILIAVTTTVSDTQQAQDAALAARRPAAEAILRQLRGGADFATVAKAQSEDYATRDSGGALPGFDRSGKTSDGKQMDPAIVQAALALQEGQISDLVRTSVGWHIVKLDKITVPSREDQLSERRTKKFDEWVAGKRAAADIQRYPPVTPTATEAPTPSPEVLPTVQLAATPTPTTVPTSTATLSGTTTLPAAPASSATAPPTIQPTPTAPAMPTGASAPTAVLPAPTPTPRP